MRVHFTILARHRVADRVEASKVANVPDIEQALRSARVRQMQDCGLGDIAAAGALQVKWNAEMAAQVAHLQRRGQPAGIERSKLRILPPGIPAIVFYMDIMAYRHRRNCFHFCPNYYRYRSNWRRRVQEQIDVRASSFHAQC